MDQSNLFSEGLTFDDVLLAPQYSEILPSEVSTESYLSRHIKIKSPILSSAMDTVTESKTAIAMAQLGGLGVIHKNMSIKDQASEVKIVKRSAAGMIPDPITVSPHATIREVIEIMKTQRISGLPVIDKAVLVGIVTGRDIRFESDLNKKVSEVMTAKVITAPKGTSHEDAVKILHKHRIEKLPVIDSNKLIGLFTVRDIENARRYPSASKDSSGSLLVGAAVGVGGDYLERTEALLQSGADVIVIDTAHGFSKAVINTVHQVKDHFSKKFSFELIAGNVATYDGAKTLIEKGVDAIKVGMGPGSICTTRVIAGIGIPQLTAILECARAAKPSGIPIIADGGIKFSGDIVKALAAGAASVMIGSLLAGTEEAPGELIIYQGKSYKSYRGMGSMGAMKRGSKDRYAQSDIEEPTKLVPEGIEGRVPYKGPIATTLNQLLGGLRSGMGYLGVQSIEQLQKTAKFVKISAAGLRESHVHDVFITREAPNYKLEEH